MSEGELWVGGLSFLLLAVGLFLALQFNQTIWIYFIAGLTGLMAGRTYYIHKKRGNILPIIIIIIGFMLGFILGAFHRNRILIIIIFITMLTLSYYLHRMKILTIFKKEGFIK